MVGNICKVVEDYEKGLQEMLFVPRYSYGRRMLQEDGGSNGMFLTYLFCDEVIAIQFVKDVRLLRCKVHRRIIIIFRLVFGASFL
jgi:hypothetical protein